MKLWVLYFSVILVIAHAEELEYHPEYPEAPSEYSALVPADEPAPANAPPPSVTSSPITPPVAPPVTPTPPVTPATPPVTPATPPVTPTPPPKNLSCICTADVNPVCGSDGVTYGNPCQLACAQKTNPDLKKAHDGECEHKCPPRASNKTTGCPCTKEFNSVCGSDGKTYGNVCVFCCAQRDNPELTIRSHGECTDECPHKESCLCEDNYDPVCGSDGNTYNNTCLLCCMKDAGVLKEHDGPCDDSTCPNVEECLCSLNFDPVCGSDGKTYNNTCLLCCHKDSGVSKVHDGPCDDGTCPNVQECLCSLNFDPVCGSDGITYNNTCLLCCHKSSGVTKVHDGPCVQNECPPPPKDNSCICPLFFLPICGTDGKTYGNLCQLCCAQRKDPDLTKSHDGPCEEVCTPMDPNEYCVCTAEFKPVCGSDYVTYDNFCKLCCARRFDTDLTKEHDGACEEIYK